MRKWLKAGWFAKKTEAHRGTESDNFSVPRICVYPHDIQKLQSTAFKSSAFVCSVNPAPTLENLPFRLSGYTLHL